MTIAARHTGKLTIAEFLAFYETRPHEERWQLIDGEAIMMTPPFPAHQRIASNIERLLNDAFEARGLSYLAYQRIGIELVASPYYRPEPDVAVVDPELQPGQRYFDRFYLAVEVVSTTDEVEERVPSKREFYRGHEPCRHLLVVRQDRCEVTVDHRVGSGWTTELLDRPEQILRMEEFGFEHPIGEFYRHSGLKLD